MITIQIKDGQNQTIGMISDFFSLSIQDEVNKGGNLKLTVPVTDWMRSTPLQKGYKISINYGISIKKNIMLFDGYISDFTISAKKIEIEANNWLSYLQHRIIRTEKKFNGVAIKTIITEIFNHINGNGQLPFVLGKNNCSKTAIKEFNAGMSFYDILKSFEEEAPELLVRVIYQNGQNVLEVGEIGKVLDGIWECDTTDPGKTNIVNWERSDTMDGFWNYVKNEGNESSNQEHITKTGLLFERFDEKKPLPKDIPLPSITISRDTDWWDFNVGDKKNIRLITGYEWLSLSYLGLIQERKISITGAGIKSEIKVSQEYREDYNILDVLLKNLRKK